MVTDIRRDPVRNDLISALLGLWILAGAGLDAWAHVNDPSVETFFTPWHMLLYTGFAAMVLWTLRVRATDDARSYRVSLIGLAVFGVGGIGDLIWHSVFGVERRLAAVMSPSHVLLFLGAVLIFSSPLRRAWARAGAVVRWRAFLPAFMSATSIGTISMLVFFHVSAFLPRGRAGGQLLTNCDIGCAIVGSYSLQQQVITSILLTHLIVFVPLLVLARRWTLPAGSITAFIAIVVSGPLAIVGFEERLPLAIAIVGALAVEVVYVILKPGPDDRTGLRLFGALGSAVFWLVYVTWTRLAYDVPWPAELLAGAVAWTAVAGAVIAAVATLRTEAHHPG